MFHYDYRCPNGHVTESSIHSQAITCHCGKMAKRKYSSFAISAIQIEPAYNVSLGKVVHSKKDMMDGFKEASDKASERHGIDMKFSPVDLQDSKALNVTRDGIESKPQARLKDFKD